MEMILLVCPKCGANLFVNAALNEAHCNYCCTKIYMDIVESLKEYKKSLIYEVVTGKKEV